MKVVTVTVAFGNPEATGSAVSIADRAAVYAAIYEVRMLTTSRPGARFTKKSYDLS